MIERLKDDLDRDDLTANELQFLRDDMLERAQDGFDYVLQAVELKLKNLNDSQDEEV